MTRLLLLMFGLLCTTFSVFSQELSGIIEKHIEALGSDASNIQNVRIEQKLFGNGIESVQTTILVPKHLFYQRVELQGGEMITYVQDSLGHSYNSFVSPDPRMMSRKGCEGFLLNTQILGPIYEYHTNPTHGLVHSVALVGDELLNEESCYHLRVTYNAGLGSADVYLSKRSYLIIKTITPYGEVTSTDYRRVGATLFPHKIKLSNNHGLVTGRVLSIKRNIKIDPEKLKLAN